ncbi:MAG: class I SAM-dependent methyltransferase [Bdellovibrionales bacterium]
MNIIGAVKPESFSSHSPGNGKVGFIEYLSEKKNIKLEIVHRLDKTTSGAMVFADNKKDQSFLQNLFAEKKVDKTYHFISSKNNSSDFFERKSLIEKHGKNWVSQDSKTPNSHTVFRKIKTFRNNDLWEAKPISGKTHQIRLHAKDLGFPILGDELYSGKKSDRVYLHCSKISFPTIKKSHESIIPLSFSDFDNYSELERTWLNAISLRQHLVANEIIDSNCYRWIHKEDGLLTCDYLNGHLWFSDFTGSNRSKLVHGFFKKISPIFELKSGLYRKMINRGDDPTLKIREEFEEVPEKWVAEENGLKFYLKKNQGQSQGIFLDQRSNRKWVYQNSKNKKVLNLFSYTSFFSVAAAAGGAVDVISVDTSKASLNWSKENFRLNDLSDEKFSFFAISAFDYIKKAKLKNQKFDLVICDPPSFARNKKSVFKIEKDYQLLLNNLFHLIEIGGKIIFSSNYEKWDQNIFIKLVASALAGKNYYLDTVLPDFDFERPGATPILKSVIITKN